MADIIRPGATAGGPINSSMMPANYDLVVIRGDSLEFFMTLTNEGVPMNLTGLTPVGMIKTGFDAKSGIPLSISTTGTPGQVRVFLSSTDTSNLLPTSTYIWNFKLTNGLGETRTYVVGDVVVDSV